MADGSIFIMPILPKSGPQFLTLLNATLFHIVVKAITEQNVLKNIILEKHFNNHFTELADNKMKKI